MGEIRPFSSRKSRIWLIIAIVLGAVVIDQVIKILVATHMMLNTGIEITPWLCTESGNGLWYRMVQ